MNAYKSYFAWLNGLMDSCADRGFFINWTVSSFCWLMCIFGLGFFFLYFLFWLVWKAIYAIYWLIRYIYNRLSH